MDNSATAQEGQSPQAKDPHECGQFGKYGTLKNEGAAKNPETDENFERDHIPSKAALFARAAKLEPQIHSNSDLKGCVNGKLEYRGFAIVIPKASHRAHSPTCGSKNTQAQIAKDGSSKANMDKAKERDTNEMSKHLKGTDCAAAYNKAAKECKKHDTEGMINDTIDECKEKLGIP